MIIIRCFEMDKIEKKVRNVLEKYERITYKKGLDIACGYIKKIN